MSPKLIPQIYTSENAMTQLVKAAQEFATRAHDGQFRKDAARQPYITHCAEVADFVTRHGGSDVAICAAWLHDTVEDCDVAPDTLTTLFGAHICAVVLELTDDPTLPKPEKKAMQVVNAPGKSPEAALVKLGDKTSNCRAVGLTPGVGWSPARRTAYLDWSETVVASLPATSATGLTEFRDVVAHSRTLIK